jgi:hypothetical protein
MGFLPSIGTAQFALLESTVEHWNWFRTIQTKGSPIASLKCAGDPDIRSAGQKNTADRWGAIGRQGQEGERLCVRTSAEA